MFKLTGIIFFLCLSVFDLHFDFYLFSKCLKSNIVMYMYTVNVVQFKVYEKLRFKMNYFNKIIFFYLPNFWGYGIGNTHVFYFGLI